MKKHTLYYIALSALAMLTGCSNEENFGLKPTDGNRSLTATIEQNDLSRTAVSEKGQVTWTETDAIGVFGTASQNIRFTYQSSTDNGNSATFRGDFPEEETMEQAYYPYQEDATLSGNALTLHLPSEYTYTGNSNAPMLGIKNNDGTFTFKHLTGLLRITINNVPEEADRFVITSSGETDAPDLAGQATITDINAENATLSITANGSKSIIYNLGTLTEETGFRTFFVPLPVGEYPQLSVALYAKDSTDPYFTKTISDITVRRAVMIDMPILDAQTGAQYVLSENTTEITESMAEHISVSPDDNTTLIYGSGIAEEDVPQVGDIIFAKVSDNFPDGFLGKVSNIQKNNDGSYTVETSVASLSEAFDELYVDETVTLTPLEETRSRADDGKTHAFNIELNFGGKGEYTAKDKSYSISTNANYGIIFGFNIALDKEKNIQQAGVTLQNAFEAGAHVAVNGTFPHNEENGELEIPLSEIKLRNIPLANGIIQITPVLTTKIVAKLKGEITAELGFNTIYKTYSGAEYKNGQWQKGSHERNQGGDNKSPWKLDGGIDGRFALEGSLFDGFAIGFDGRLYNRDDMKLSIGAEAGMNIGGQVEINNENAESLEQVLSDVKLTSSLTIDGSLSVDASLIAPGDELQGTITVFQGELFKREIPLFPDIKKPEAKVTPEETTEAEPEPTYAADVETEVQGPTLMENVEIAYAIEDEETGEVLEISEPIPYSGEVEGELMGGETPIEEVKPVKTAFKELKQEVSYIVYPVISSPFLNSVIKKYDMSLKQQAININIAPEKSEREILIEFYNATGGDNWTNNTNWCTDEPLDTWYGIRTDNEGKVWDISLSNNNLTGDAYLADLTNLDYLSLHGNKLTSITLSNLPLLRYLGAGDDGASITPLANISMSRLTNLKNIDLRNVENFDLSGLTTLQYLGITPCKPVDLDLTEFADLLSVTVSGQVTSLNINGLQNLKSITCHRTQVTNLDFSKLKNLETVSCQNNSLLKNLTIAQSKNLTRLTCNENEQLTSLDLSGTEKLERIECKYNQIINLDLSTSPNITLINCYGNKLQTLSINSDKLESLLCQENQLSNLDFSNAKNITVLSCGYNQLLSLDISQLQTLKSMSCDDNQITELDFSNNKEITSISCDDNLLTSLEFPTLENLTYLSCTNNPLKILDVSNLTSLQKLYCENNQMEIVDISGISDSIEHLQFHGSFVKKVYISIQEESYKQNVPSWGEQNVTFYPEPNHWSGYQYPEFIYK